MSFDPRSLHPPRRQLLNVQLHGPDDPPLLLLVPEASLAGRALVLVDDVLLVLVVDHEDRMGVVDLSALAVKRGLRRRERRV